MKKNHFAIFAVLFTSFLISESALSSKKPDLKVSLPHVFGINIDNDPGVELEFNATKEANFKWVRLWFSWRSMERFKEGEINWTEMDRQVDMALQRRLTIFATFWGIPGWANNTPPDCQPWSTFNCSYPPTDRKFFGNFVRKVVARYKGRIKYWGLGNEPNHGAFWNRIPAQGARPE
ncbi:MAG: endo-1,4-beta-xylanase, partial [Bdellovibrionales bacterium]|nr:endo-1,4-beta-xylanase [Bdellovibrionales bacterium]